MKPRAHLTLATACALTTSAVSAQVSWAFEHPDNGFVVRIVDAAVTNSGYVLVSSKVNIQNGGYIVGQSSLHLLNSAGAHVVQRTIGGDSVYVASVILDGATDDAFEVIGITESAAGRKLFRLRIDDQLAGLDSTAYGVLANEALDIANATRSSNGDLILPCSASLSTWQFVVTVLRLNLEGDSLSSTELDGTAWFTPRDIVEQADGSWIMGSFGAPNQPGYDASFVSYVKFDADLNYAGGFSGPRIDGTDAIANFQNTLNDQHKLMLLASGNMIVGGRLGSLSSGFKGAIQRMTANGNWLGSIILDTPSHHDHPAILGNLAPTADGNLLFAMVANFESGPPSPFLPEEPSKVHIYKLDTALNVLCTNVIDGFVENAYYFVDRIIATLDGGYLLVGSRVDLSDPEQPWVGWARKFGPDDCFTGMEVEAGAPLVIVAPNPGSDELRITLNGPDRQAVAALVDLNGRIIATESLRFGQARFATHSLAAGVYAYTIADGAGGRIACGRWLKE